MKMNSLFASGETAHYQIKLFKDVRKSETAGTLRTSLKEVADLWEIKTDIETEKSRESARVKVRKENFAPLEYSSHTLAEGGEFDIRATYAKHKVDITAQTPRGIQNVTLDLPPKSFDNSSAFYLFRAVAFGLLDDKKFHLINVNTASKVLVTLEQLEEEPVSAAAGEFTCVALKLIFPQLPSVPFQRFLFNKAHPPVLIKNVSGPQVIELLECSIP